MGLALLSSVMIGWVEVCLVRHVVFTTEFHMWRLENSGHYIRNVDREYYRMGCLEYSSPYNIEGMEIL